jgi:superfamily I DNA/RNA helicase
VLDEDAEAAFLAKVTSEAGLRTCRPRASRFRGRGNGKPSTELDARLAERKRAENVMSFDDLIDGAIALLKEPGESAARCKPQWILVDEGQDCASRELSFIDALRGPATRLFIVGDPLQSIYGWRGSAGAFFATPSQTPTVREYSLPTSYRSTRTILEGARAILGLQPHAAGILSPVRDVGEPIVLRRHHDPIAEAVYLADRVSDLLSRGFSTSEVAILARLKAQLEPIRRVLSERGLPIADDGTTRPDGVRLLTLHSAKGLEFRQVFISGVNQGLVPLAHGAVDDAEERRLLFVGMTRARDRVELGVHARPDQAYALGLPSPYLQTLPASLVEHRDGPEKPTEIALPTCAAGTTTSSSPWRVGQRAQHARYGIGVVTGVGETVICDFGKLGTREFPLRLCPLRLWLGVPQ